MSRWVIEWVSRQVENFYSSVSLISSITHSWCTWHFHDKSFCHRTSAPGANVLKCPICPERKWRSEKRDRGRGSWYVFVCLSAELLTVTGSPEWIAKVTVFWVTSAVKKTQRREQGEEECQQIESKNASYQEQSMPSTGALAPAVGASSSLLVLTKRK